MFLSIKPSIIEDEPELIIGGVLNLIKAINISFLPRVLQASLRSNQVINQHLKEDFFLDLFFTLVFWNKRLKKEVREAFKNYLADFFR